MAPIRDSKSKAPTGAPAPIVRVKMQPHGGGRRGDYGPNHGGFRGGFQERGRGRMPPRHNSWKRKDGGALEEKGKVKNTEDSEGKEAYEQVPDPAKSKWEEHQGKQDDKQNTWGSKGCGVSTGGHPEEGSIQHASANPQSSNTKQ